ncbi:MAG: 16S rRNA (guanine(966)-N(2))-methyltransferase RsmD [Clostridia bacterium]|nr:16S rRNA (guanine(966)-N(2))-methyltransferase RsmD [Clostridia bacterium]
MRVISGKFRGKKLACLEGDDIRPTLDRVKETLFNIIQFQVANSTVLDLFAGSGALGIEALSRGAKQVYFCDSSPMAVKVVKYNLEGLKPDGAYDVMRCDYMTALHTLSGTKFDFIFADPPFAEGMYYKILDAISNRDMLNSTSIVTCEHLTKADLPERVGKLVKYRESVIGNTTLSFYKLAD